MTSKTRGEPPEPSAVLRGQRRYLYLWRLRGMVTWLAQQVTPASWWDRRVVPGHLVAVAWSDLTILAVERSLSHLRRHKWFKVDEESTRHGPTESALPVVAWRLRVPRGMEEPVLRELEYRVANALAKAGGYASIDRRLKLRAARCVMAAHQSRRTYAMATSAKVEFTPIHDVYSRMVVASPDHVQPFPVAVIDTNVELTALANAKVKYGPVEDEAKEIETDPHGAMTISVIASLAPWARIKLYPAISKRRKDEGLVVHALAKLCEAPVPADAPGVLVMALAIDFPKWRRFARTDRETVETLLGILAPNWVIVAAAGNRDKRWRKNDARYPGTSRHALMVGAVDSDYNRPEYACYRLKKARPAAFLVAPGGTEDESPVTAGKIDFHGTSVATAYAAGVIGRSIASLASTDPGSVRQAMVASAFRWPDHNATEHGSGLTRQADP